jgi:hypothetical protein
MTVIAKCGVRATAQGEREAVLCPGLAVNNRTDAGVPEVALS